MRTLAAAAVLAAALTGCSTTPTPAPVTPGPAVVEEVPAPVSVQIPDIAVRSGPLMALGLDRDGALESPPVDQPQIGGWYADGVRPGAPGPAILAAHVNGRVNGRSTPGLFARITELRPGAPVLVTRADGSTVTYRVVATERYPKAQGIPAAVYADTPQPELRLITCGGAFDPRARSYRDNIIVSARMDDPS